MRRTTLLLTAALLAGCGSSSDTASPTTSVTADATAQHNDADVTFVQDMSPHHEGAVAMAQLAPERAASPAVKALAAAILAAQQPELDTMTELAKAWDVTLTGGAHDMDMGGMGSHGGDEAALEPLTGTAFDREFLTRMTAHHRDALPMAQAELDGGSSARAKALAQSILTTQQAEIRTMQDLLAAL